MPPDKLLGCGLWLDGVPCNFDRSRSLQVVSLSLPGLVGEGAKLRFPLTVIEDREVLLPHTFDDILEQVAKSFEILATGVYENDLHLPKKLRGKAIGVNAVLAEVRGDWKMMKQTFRFPQHNEKAGCCWKCLANQKTIRFLLSSDTFSKINLQGVHAGGPLYILL